MAKKLRGEIPSDGELVEIVDRACNDYVGDATVLESAIGALVWGRVVGWQALRLMHTGRTFKRYEEILGVKFKEVLDPVTDQAERMKGYRMMKKVGKFWQAVSSGTIPAREGAVTDRR
jgi:hypothetical protein